MQYANIIQNPVIYCDMDGVLVDFENNLIKLMNNIVKNYGSLAPKYKQYVKTALQSINAWPIKKNFSFIHKNIKIETSTTEIGRLVSEVIKRNKNFWISLPKKRDGILLWNFLMSYPEVYILTIAIDEDCKQGKIEWVEKHLGISGNKVFFSNSKNAKSEYASKNSILIDDTKYNIERFQCAGGNGILFTSFGLILPKLLSELCSFA